ncbi:AraD1 family protein [Enterovibrio norvegicus]|uniref:AraD1 family protein n=1 Tax=Enterovibrio norvegicus TaxID=188144 RepID=UPI000300A873|nr:AraD1 family protein [Enterovibrio norvegicus]OEE60183.1 FAH family protein [Enterovibrio norvegicus]
MSFYRIIQYKSPTGPRVAKVLDDESLQAISLPLTTYELVNMAINEETTLTSLIDSLLSEHTISYQSVIDDGLLLPPIHHPDNAHCFVTGTGLTHLGSADTRDAMHAKIAGEEATLTDSMRMFKMGFEDGKATSQHIASQPEWFYKGTGNIIRRPYGTIESPAFAQDAGEEPELVGVYVNDSNGTPHRVGFAIGNEFSDHVTERHNYLWLAHSKLRQASFGPELMIGDLPPSLEGSSKIIRNKNVVWEKPFTSGEDNMSHNIKNLEHHHFKYALFCQPGDLNIHYFGTSTLSFADGIETQDGDVFEICVPEFGKPLRNTLTMTPKTPSHPIHIAALR